MTMVLAEHNVSRMKKGLTDVERRRFDVGAAAIQRAARLAPGHIWSQQDVVAGDLYATRSIWASVEALRAFVYSGVHLRYLRRGASWFETTSAPSLVLWWIAEGERPTLAQATSRLERLRAEGAGLEAFDFGWAESRRAR